jgi:hypothetical protein
MGGDSVIFFYFEENENEEIGKVGKDWLWLGN